MIEKIKGIFGSIRFWILTLTAVIAILVSAQNSGLNLVEVLKIAEGWLVAVAALGTADSVAKNLAGTK